MEDGVDSSRYSRMNFLFFFAFAFCFAAEWGVVFYLFLAVKDRALPTYLTYVMTTNQHIYPSSTHSRQFFYHPRFFVYIHCADSFSGFLPLSTKKMWKLSFVQVWRPNSLLMRMFSTKSFFLLLIYYLFFLLLRSREK